MTGCQLGERVAHRQARREVHVDRVHHDVARGLEVSHLRGRQLVERRSIVPLLQQVDFDLHADGQALEVTQELLDGVQVHAARLVVLVQVVVDGPDVPDRGVDVGEVHVAVAVPHHVDGVLGRDPNRGGQLEPEAQLVDVLAFTEDGHDGLAERGDELFGLAQHAEGDDEAVDELLGVPHPGRREADVGAVFRIDDGGGQGRHRPSHGLVYLVDDGARTGGRTGSFRPGGRTGSAAHLARMAATAVLNLSLSFTAL